MRESSVYRMVCAFLVVSLALIGCYSETARSRVGARNGSICTQGTSDVFLEAVVQSASVEVDSSDPGVSTGLRVKFLIPMGIREAQEVVITAPSEFGFLGFDALGPGAQIGSWEFDFANPDGVFDTANVMARVVAMARQDPALLAGAHVTRDAEGKQTLLDIRNELGDDPFSAIVASEQLVGVVEQLLGERAMHYHHKLMLKE